MKRYFILPCALLLIAGAAHANVWIDETFEDSPAFNDVDTYDYTPPATPALQMTDTGSLSTAKAFDGSQSYLLAAGQSINWVTCENPGNGALQYLQFAVNIGSIPAAGTMATLVYDFRFTDPVTDYSYFIDFVSTGSAVQLVAGENVVVGTSAVIDTITDTNTWKYITLQVNKDTAPQADTTLGQTGLTQGARFFCSSASPQMFIPTAALHGGLLREFLGASLTVNSGQLYLDAFYWEGGMTWDSTTYANRNVRDPETGTALSVDDWKSY